MAKTKHVARQIIRIEKKNRLRSGDLHATIKTFEFFVDEGIGTRDKMVGYLLLDGGWRTIAFIRGLS